MTTVPAAIIGLTVLASAGLLPTVALIGLRLVTVPLLPLVGAVVAAMAATCFMALGWSFTGWFGALAAAGALIAVAHWIIRPDRRPWRGSTDPGTRRGLWPGVVGAVGAVAILGACVWCLRGLATPTVGFDARALWLMRAGWFLQSHHQLLVDMRVRDVVLVQTPYPPLVSASTALAWSVTGNESVRLGVVIIALLNTCALAVAAFALVESARQFARRLLAADQDGAGSSASRAVALREQVPLTPLVVGIASAALLVFVAFGITEPFMTNGYADPIWSLAAVGAVAYGLQLGINRVNQGVTLILVLVAGMSKNEGVVTAVALIALVAIRGLAAMSGEERHRRWWRPILLGLAQLTAVAAWPALMRVIHARGVSMSYSPLHDMAGRARTAYDGMSPYLHVIVLAVPVAVVGGVVLSRVRRRSGVANDWWAWAGLASGLGAVGGAYVTSNASVQVWLVGTVDRVTEFPALTAWWIVAMWAVVAAGTPAATRRHASPLPSDARSEVDADVEPSLRPFGRAPSPAAVAAG
jgi:hypothetical protein